MKCIKSYLLEVAGAIVVLAIMASLFQGRTKATFGSDVLSYGKDWDIEIDGVVTHYEELPSGVDNPDRSPVILRKKLPLISVESKSIGFFTTHQNVTVYLDDLQIYSFKAPERSHSKTPGNGWNFIDLKKAYAERELAIVLEPSYQSVSGVIPEIFYGDKDAVLAGLVKSAVVPLFLCSVVLIIGIAVILAVIFLRKGQHIPAVLVWLGLFAIFLSMWSGLETQMFPVFFGNHLFFNQLTFVSLQLAYVPIMMFVRYAHNLEENRIMKFFCMAGMILFPASVALQALGIKDFRETLFLNHILFIAGALWILYLAICALKEEGDHEQRKVTRYHVIGVGIAAATVLIDSIGFYSNTMNSVGFTRFGFLIYITIFIIMTLNNSIQLMHIGEEAEAIKEVAYQDALTKLGNRNAYEAHLGGLAPSKWPVMSVAIFDLNNLKYFNDAHGHSMGDYYIIICSEVIQDIFGKKGVVYRTGGDEFCALVEDVSEEEFMELKEKMEQRLLPLSSAFFEGKMSLASGYAHFEEGVDENFNNTIKRADQCMYLCKEEMKKNPNLVVPIDRTPEAQQKELDEDLGRQAET